MIEELLEAKRKFEEDRAAAQAEYEANIERMKAEYDQVTIVFFLLLVLFFLMGQQLMTTFLQSTGRSLDCLLLHALSQVIAKPK